MLWKVDDETLFPLLLLVCGPVPEGGWKFLSDAHTWMHLTGKEAKVYRRQVDKYLADNHYLGPRPYVGYDVNNLVAAKRNQFFRWVWQTRFPDAMHRDKKYPPRFRQRADDPDEEVPRGGGLDQE